MRVSLLVRRWAPAGLSDLPFALRRNDRLTYLVRLVLFQYQTSAHDFGAVNCRHACILLSNHLLALHPTSASSVLELGAGVGLLSLLSARSSPIGTKITSTDVDEHVLERLSENILISAFPTRRSLGKGRKS